jgi:hypothetical protein
VVKDSEANCFLFSPFFLLLFWTEGAMKAGVNAWTSKQGIVKKHGTDRLIDRSVDGGVVPITAGWRVGGAINAIVGSD